MPLDRLIHEPKPHPDRLIAEARGGSQEALNQLLELLSEHLWEELGCRRRRRGLGPSRGVSDLIQETLVRAREGFGRFERDTLGDFKQWARTILFRRWQQWAQNYQRRNSASRRERIWRIAQQRDAPPLIVDPLVREEETERANRLFAKSLRPNERMIIEMRLLQGLRFREIAELCHTSENAANQAFRRAIGRLRELFHSDAKS